MSRIGWLGSVRFRDFQPRSTISSLITLAARSASVSSLVCVTVAEVLSEALQAYLLQAALIVFQSRSLTQPRSRT
jgi:hypothetical protein